MSTIFISGNSQGLGLGLTRYFLQQQHQLYSISRSNCPIDHPDLNHRGQDIDTAARRIGDSFSRCLDFESGSFIDIRELSAP